ncbi:flavin reductase family protein [Pseudonocardia halophobica]|uniref:flavin reductase family protein n=1 Tax=Pseudonocardia halophobica TaxID=29401 RepID=UPI003D89B915
MTITTNRTAIPVSGERFRSIMGEVCAQVAVVTTTTEAGPHGTTVTAFCSLSLDPPMVCVALDRGSRLLAAVHETRRVGINLLAEGHDALAMRFASKGDDKFAGTAWTLSAGLPRLDGNAGWVAGEVLDFVGGGDHVVLFCLVTAAETADRRPLVYSRRTFGTHSGLLPA